MKNIRLILLAALTILSASACKSKYQTLLQGNNDDAKYAAAFQYFNQGKYDKATELFESVSVSAAGTERDDTVQFFWGLSNYRAKDFFTAETNFERFNEHFPRSTFSEDAQFYYVDCLYRNTYRAELDQTPTYKAVAALAQYMADHPYSPHYKASETMLQDLNDRLDKKAYINAKLYYDMEDYKASGVAFHNILKDDPDNIYREDILYYCSMSSYKYALNSVQDKQKERYMSFLDDYYNFVSEYQDSKYRTELDRLYSKVKDLEEK